MNVVITDEKNFDHLTDQECWIRLQGGCKKSLETIYYRYFDKLYGYAVSFCGSRELAEDQLQSLFLKIWEMRQEMAHVKYVKTYLWVALRRSLMDVQERESRFQQNLDAFKPGEFNIISSAEDILLLKETDRETLEHLYEAIETLNHRQKEILYLKFFEGMSYQEIEEITSLQYQSVRNYIYEAVKSLKSILQEKSNGRPIQLSPVVLLGLACLFWV